MLTYHLSGIDIFAWIDKELSTILQFVNGIGKGVTRVHRDHRTIDTTLYLTLIRLILLKAMSHDSLALRSRQYVSAQTDNTTRWNIELDIHTLPLIVHRGHLTFTACHHINHLRREFLRHVDGQFLDRLALLAVDFLIDHLWLSYLQFIALTTHGLDKDREVEHATS